MSESDSPMDVSSFHDTEAFDLDNPSGVALPVDPKRADYKAPSSSAKSKATISTS